MCKIRSTFSTILHYVSCVLFRIQLYVIVNSFSRLFFHLFSFLVSSLTCSTNISKDSFPFIICYNSAAFFLARDSTSYMILTWSLYNDLVGTLSITNSTFAKSFSGVWVMASSIQNIVDVTWKFGLAYAIVWMVSCLLDVALSSTSIVVGKDYVPLSCIYTTLVYSRTCLMLANSSWIRPLWCWVSSNSSFVHSCTFSAIRLMSSSVIVYYGNCLCTLEFLQIPLVCMFGCLDFPISYGIVVEGVSCVVVSPIPCSPCASVVSFFPSCTSLFGALPFFCCAGFWLGFIFFSTTLSPTCLLDPPYSTSFLATTS